MANLSKVISSERIRDEGNANFIVSDFAQQQPIVFNDEHVFSNSQDSEDNVVYEDVFLNVIDAPDFETELLSYVDSPAWKEINFETRNATSNFVNSNIYMNVPSQMYNPIKTNIMENSQFLILNNTSSNVDYSSQNNNEDSLEKYKNLEDIPLVMSQKKDEDNNRLMDNVLNDFCNNLENQQYKKELNLSLECSILPNDASLPKAAPTTPELYDTIEKLEIEQYSFEQVSLHKCSLKI